jgi:hypothetical protein
MGTVKNKLGLGIMIKSPKIPAVRVMTRIAFKTKTLLMQII